MSSRPHTIQIYLPDGNPRGIRVAEVTTGIVRVVEVPQALLNEFLGMEEAKQVGLYFLVGDEQADGRVPVYIGQTQKTGQRLVDHNKSKDYWTRALVVVLRTDSMTNTHALYLEWLSIKTAIDAGRYNVKNANGGSKPHTTAPLEADCETIFEAVRTLITTLGQPVFEPFSATRPARSDESELFYCNYGKARGIGRFSGNGMVVLKGSLARLDTTPSMAKPEFLKYRDALVAEGALVQEGMHYVLHRDVLCSSPSAASKLITGSSTNGWVVWKTKCGMTLDEVKRPKV